MKLEKDLSISDNIDNIICMHEFIQYSLNRPDGLQLNEEQAIGAGLIIGAINNDLENIKQKIQTNIISINREKQFNSSGS